MCNNPKENAAGDFMGLVQHQIEGLSPSTFQSLDLAQLDKRANDLYDQSLNMGNANLTTAMRTALKQNTESAGNSAYTQGAALNLSNPFALKNVLEGKAYGQTSANFAPMFAELQKSLLTNKNNQLLGNVETANKSQQNATSLYYQTLLNLLQAKSGQIGNRSGGAQEWLPGVISAGAQVGSAALTGGSKGAAGSASTLGSGTPVQSDYNPTFA